MKNHQFLIAAGEFQKKVGLTDRDSFITSKVRLFSFVVGHGSLIFLLLNLFAQTTSAAWPQWGGPQRNFHVPEVQIADEWPEKGLKQIWKRPLGDGFSTILVINDRLFTMHRKDGHEHITALKADTGTTVWEYAYPVEFLEGTNVEDFGPGPLSTPLIVKQRIFAVGVTGLLHCLDLENGKLLWKHNLIADFQGTNLYRGYSASPIAYGDTVILPIGGSGNGVMAFRMGDGTVAWASQDFQISHVSPILIQFENQFHLVVVAEKQIVGLDPRDGRLLWQLSHPIIGGHIASTPVWDGSSRLFFSAAYGEGSRCLQLTRQADQIMARELWHNQQMRVHHSNVIRIGDHLYGTSGDFAALVFTALNLTTGKVVWRERQLGRAAILLVDNKFLAMQEDGTLMLVTASPKELIIHHKAKLFDSRAWTTPTLHANRLFIRNREEIMAIEFPLRLQ